MLVLLVHRAAPAGCQPCCNAPSLCFACCPACGPLCLCPQKWDLTRMVGSGGMPSSHTALVRFVITYRVGWAHTMGPRRAAWGQANLIDEQHLDGLDQNAGRPTVNGRYHLAGLRRQWMRCLRAAASHCVAPARPGLRRLGVCNRAHCCEHVRLPHQRRAALLRCGGILGRSRGLPRRAPVPRW